jgi:hypothetical protein
LADLKEEKEQQIWKGEGGEADLKTKLKPT